MSTPAGKRPVSLFRFASRAVHRLSAAMPDKRTFIMAAFAACLLHTALEKPDRHKAARA